MRDDFLPQLRRVRARLIRIRDQMHPGLLVISDLPQGGDALNVAVQAALVQDAINSINLAIKSQGKASA